MEYRKLTKNARALRNKAEQVLNSRSINKSKKK